MHPRVLCLLCLLSLISLLVLSGCTRVDLTEVQVRDAHAVGVVADDTNRWLVPPSSSASSVDAYKNFATTVTVDRSSSGALTYVASNHWLVHWVDETLLMDARGRTAWVASSAETARLDASMQRGGELRLRRILFVVDSGVRGGTTNPAVPISLATDSANIEEVRIQRTPIRGFGVFEVVLGGVSVSFGTVAGAAILADMVDHPSGPRGLEGAVLGASAGLVALGGLVIGNGIWRLVTPDRRLVYRPATASPAP
jgi:hypothetical protein